jgi:hypothetical protein
MVKPHTTSRHGGKPHHRPERDHFVMSEKEQAKFLGRGEEVTMNLGHRVHQDDLVKHPLGKTQNYDSADTERTFRDRPKLQGVYKKTADPKSGISSADNLKAWSKYADSNRYTGHGNKAGHGKDPTMPDPRGSHSNESDGYLAPLPSPSEKYWADYRAGSESGEGRLEKLHHRK